MKKTYSLHKITNEINFTFCPSEYSKFKFGDKPLAIEFGRDLFKGFIQEFKEDILNNDVVVFPSPYMSIPTASNFLARSFKEELDMFLYDHNLRSSSEGKINRNQTFTEDYGNLSFEDRKKLIANDTYYLDKNLLEGKTCIFIDDVKITGSHEFTVEKILNEYGVNGNFIYVYYAELDNKDIDPKIENYFNYHQKLDAELFIDLINDTDIFVFNTRVIKYLLKLPSLEFESIVDGMTNERQNEMKSYAISNNYHLIDEYKHNLKTLVEWQSIYRKESVKQ